MESNKFIDLQKVQIAGWTYIIVVSIASWIFLSWSFAWSVLAGGGIVMLSFLAAQKDVAGFLGILASTPEDEEAEGQEKTLKRGKKGFILKFWLRIVIIGVVLLVVIKSGRVNIFGLILGLSTIVFAITFTALNVVRHYFIRRR